MDRDTGDSESIIRNWINQNEEFLKHLQDIPDISACAGAPAPPEVQFKRQRESFRRGFERFLLDSKGTPQSRFIALSFYHVLAERFRAAREDLLHLLDLANEPTSPEDFLWELRQACAAPPLAAGDSPRPAPFKIWTRE